ncbi:MAG: hypothetical protein K5867_05565 [Bacteroidales bacterium]|nr:hypothetical protein [Bacteroidales bacterium]
MKTLRFFVAFVIVCCTITTLTSCQSKADKAVKQLGDLVTRLDQAGADYQSETWQQATKEYSEILSDMQKCKMSEEKRLEIQQLNAKYGNLKVAALTVSADKFVASLGDDGRDAVKVITSNDARVFYTKETMSSYGMTEKVELICHDVLSGSNTNLKESMTYGLNCVHIIGLIGDRLFYNEFESEGETMDRPIGYVNIKDNSDHGNLFTAMDIDIAASDQLKVTRPSGSEYTVSSTLSDSEYRALNEKWTAEEAKRNTDWLQGTWEYSGYDPIAGRMVLKLVIDGDYVTWYGNGRLMDSGRMDIDIDEQRITFGRDSYMDIDTERQLIYTGSRSEGTRFQKSSSIVESSSSYSGGRLGGNASYGRNFNTSTEVMAYVGNKFRNSAGNVIRVKSYGIVCNGTQITNGVRVVSFNGSRATLTATSPYAHGTQHFYVDASRGTITDGTGDVFYIQ